jgi:hypothetical protein
LDEPPCCTTALDSAAIKLRKLSVHRKVLRFNAFT